MTTSWRARLVDLLASSLIFADVPRAELESLARAAKRVELDDEAMFWAWGAESGGVAVVLDGKLDVQRTFENDRTVVFRRVSRGDILGFSTLAGEVHTADVVAAEPSVVALLPPSSLRAFLARRPEVALRVIGHLGHLIGLLTDEKVTWRAGTVKERISAWLEANVAVGCRLWITQAELGRHVGASRENVSRALRDLASDKEKAIQKGRGWIKRCR